MKKIIRKKIKVFLLDFPDVPHPIGYDKEFVENLFFGTTSPIISPAPDNPPLVKSIYQYFFGISDGWLRVEGEVVDWVTASFNARDVPHWNRGTMTAPSNNGGIVDFGEMWPPVVAETLRQNELTTDVLKKKMPGFLHGFNTHGLDTLVKGLVQKEIRKLQDGGQADLLVFIHSDVIVQGVKRGFNQTRTQLKIMGHPKVSTRNIPGTSNRWDSLWDEAWHGLPNLAAVTLVVSDPQRNDMQNDGTFPPGTSTTVRMSPYEVILHELSHLILDLPDMYGAQEGPFFEYDLMHGIRSHFPQTIGSYLRNELGWLKFKEISRESRVLSLQPSETHNLAIRMTNGAPGSNHYLVIENLRERQMGLDWSVIPPDLGQGLYIYRLDEHRRLRTPNGSGTTREHTQVIMRTEDPKNGKPWNAGESWKVGESIGSVASDDPTKLTGTVTSFPAKYNQPATLRNPAGELWWTLPIISNIGNGDLEGHFELQALHLVQEYHKATWESQEGGVTKVLTPDEFEGHHGHVMMVDATMAINRRQKGKAIYFHPPWGNAGRLTGTYNIAGLGNHPTRLYVKLAMPDDAMNSNGVRVRFQVGPEIRDIFLSPGEEQWIVHDFPVGMQLQVEIHTSGNANRDWVYLLDGWVVSLANDIQDLVATASNASWASDNGAITFADQGKPTGEVSIHGPTSLLDEVEYGPHSLFTHPNWDANGYIEGTWPVVNIPSDGAFLRAMVGFGKNRKQLNKGVTITIQVIDRSGGNGTITLIQEAPLIQYAKNSRVKMERNDPMLLELALPDALRGESVQFKVRINAFDGAAQDWVFWPYLRVTRD